MLTADMIASAQATYLDERLPLSCLIRHLSQTRDRWPVSGHHAGQTKEELWWPTMVPKAKLGQDHALQVRAIQLVIIRLQTLVHTLGGSGRVELRPWYQINLVEETFRQAQLPVKQLHVNHMFHFTLQSASSGKVGMPCASSAANYRQLLSHFWVTPFFHCLHVLPPAHTPSGEGAERLLFMYHGNETDRCFPDYGPLHT
jgi:hypothetical protein